MKKLPKSIRDAFIAKSEKAQQAVFDAKRTSDFANNKFAHDFAEITGVEGVAGHWTLPRDLTMDELWKKVDYCSLSHEEQASLLKEIIKLNPELEIVDYKDWIDRDPKKVDDFLGGIATGINAYDINYYLNSFDYEECKARKKELTKQLGIAPGGGVSPETAQMIRDHFGLSAPNKSRTKSILNSPLIQKAQNWLQTSRVSSKTEDGPLARYQKILAENPELDR